MAGKTQAEKGKGKGVAFGKWAKIDKAQRNMFFAVCGASVVLGITIVGIIYFSKVISFNATLIGEKAAIIEDYKDIQNSLVNISNQVNNLAVDDTLEVVGRTRAADCLNRSAKMLTESSSVEDLEVTRTCTALRVIPDAMPSSANTEAMLAGLNQLLLWSNDGNGVLIEGLSGTDTDGVSFVDENGNAIKTTMSAMGAAVSIEDDADKVKGALDTIENSIRNYDIAAASIEWSGDNYDDDGVYHPQRISLSASFNAYYSNSVSIEKQKKKVCASKESAKCTGKKKK
jgi:hypothetical protein